MSTPTLSTIPPSWRHQRVLTTGITSKRQCLKKTSIWSKHSHPSPPLSVDSYHVLYRDAARMLSAGEENAATASAAALITHHHPWYLQGRLRKWRERISLFVRAQRDRCHPTCSLIKSWSNVKNKEKKWKVIHPKYFLLLFLRDPSSTFPSSVTRTEPGLRWVTPVGETKEEHGISEYWDLIPKMNWNDLEMGLQKNSDMDSLKIPSVLLSLYDIGKFFSQLGYRLQRINNVQK